MGLAIIGVVELVGPKPAVLLGEALRLTVVIARVAVWLLGYRDHPGSQSPEQMDLLEGLGFWYDDDRRITARAAYYGTVNK
jgi:hypothetical protein